MSKKRDLAMTLAVQIWSGSWPNLTYCPFEDEPGRPAAERYPCPEQYRPTCGCHRDGKPSPKFKWTGRMKA